MYKKIFLLFCSVILLVSQGCIKSPFYQREEAVPASAWSYNFKPVFKINVTDTTAAYRTYFIFRHTEAYPFSNIWMWVYTRQPHDTAFQRSRINIQLTEPSGKWLGRGMGEIYEQYLPVSITDSSGALFKKKGEYEIKFEQNMRISPLPQVLHVGLRVEKV